MLCNAAQFSALRCDDTFPSYLTEIQYVRGVQLRVRVVQNILLCKYVRAINAGECEMYEMSHSKGEMNDVGSFGADCNQCASTRRCSHRRERRYSMVGIQQLNLINAPCPRCPSTQ